MLIDWFTVFAQVVNFLILVWLMKRFLYKPILDAIDSREQKIAKELADADAQKADAQREHEEFQLKNDQFDKHHAALLSKVAKEANVERQRLLDEAKQESEGLRTKFQESLNSEHQSLSDDITRQTRAEVFAIARKALVDLASTSLEDQIAQVFVTRLTALNDKEKGDMQAAFKGSQGKATVSSAFELNAKQRITIENAIKEIGVDQSPVSFATSPEHISGIELSANGWKLAWSIADYLGALDKEVGDLLQARSVPEPVKK